MNTMRILWITHDLFECFLPYVKGNPTKGGSWIAPLFYSMKEQSGVKLGSVTPVVNGESQQKEIDGIAYYSIPMKKKENTKDMSEEQASGYLWAINDFKPDIIHVHGTEKNFGLLRKYVNANIPIVCSIQGIILPYYDSLKFSVAAIDIEKYRSLKNRLGRGGVNFTLKKWEHYSLIEREIYRINNYFIGRTTWDKAQLMSLNPGAAYFHGEELLRAEFYTQRWEIDRCERHRIFVSSAAYPIKGFHVLLKAAAMLKQEYPDIKVIAPLATINMSSSLLRDYLINEDYANYLKRMIKELGMEDNVIFKTRLSSAEMALEYSKAHVFALPSFIENSPNSLGESMMIGVPSIAASVGGVPDIVKDNESSLLFSPGDYASLAYQIRRIFSDDTLAMKMSRKAQNIAQRRHNIADTTQQYLAAYFQIIEQHHENTTYTL